MAVKSLKSKEVVVIAGGTFLHILGHGTFVHYVFSVGMTSLGRLTIKEDLHMLNKFCLRRNEKNAMFIYHTGRQLFPYQYKRKEYCQIERQR